MDNSVIDKSIVFEKGNLVIYKEKTAIVTASGSKIDIKLAAGKSVKVRPKDIQLLHVGPVSDFSQLQISVDVNVNEVREILEGETTSFDDLMELMYEQNTPAAAGAVYEIIKDGLYFSGTIDEIHPNTQDEYEREFNRRNEKEAEKNAWAEFIERVHKKKILESDHERLNNLQDVAYGKSCSSKILKELKIETTPENAHTLLLTLGYWDFRINPYIKRFGFSTDVTYPEVPVVKDEERLDLTHLAAFAIDDEGNTDPDDAISYDNGKLWIHVADVASMVQPESPLDIHAKSQIANLYLPEKTVTMFPVKITELFGLGLSEISPALSFCITLKESGEIEQVEIHPTRIKVTRTTYRKAEEMLEQSPLKEIHALTQKYQANRKANNAVFLNFPEVNILVKDDDIQITLLPQLETQNVVTNAMLMAGEGAAKFAQENQIPFPYTTQPAPDLNEIPETIRTPETLSEMFAYRKFLKPGQIKSTAEPHAGLGLRAYSRATSPIRRYVDLIAHQQIRACLKGQPVLDEQQMLNRVGAFEAIIGSVTKLERLSNRHWTLVYLMQHPDWIGKGILIDKRVRFYIVLIPELGLESRISLKQDFELDTEIMLSVKDIDLPRLDVYFKLEE